MVTTTVSDKAHESRNIAFMSSHVLNGDGYGVVVRTGDGTFIGHFNALTSSTQGTIDEHAAARLWPLRGDRHRDRGRDVGRAGGRHGPRDEVRRRVRGLRRACARRERAAGAASS
jgi:magnesium-transporting ATPase (P-type)